MAFWYSGALFEGGLFEQDGAAALPLDNAGLRFGATVFTTMRVYDQDLAHPLTQWQKHCDRLTDSLQAFGWQPPNWAALHSGCEALKSRYSILRITLFPDGNEWITGRNLPALLAQQQASGIACWVAPPDYTRSLPAHKTGNYLACWLARQQANCHGADEAILTNDQGDWLETSTGNLWGWAQGQWWTPLDTPCLPGLMRDYLRRLLSANGQRVVGQRWDLQQLMRFEAIAYSNCAVQLLPVHTIISGTSKLKYSPQHSSLKALQRQLAQLASI